MKPNDTSAVRVGIFGLLLALGAAPASAGELFKTIPAIVFDTDRPSEVSSSGHYARYCAGEECTFVADAKLPHGATIVGLEIDACQTSAFWDLNFALLAVNVNEALTGGTDPYSVEVHSTATSGCAFTKAEAPIRNETDQFNKSYLVVVSVHSGVLSECGTDIPCPGFESRFSAVRVFYEVNDTGTVEPTKALAGVLFP